MTDEASFSIRAVDPTEAETDIEVRHALSLFEQITSGKATARRWDPLELMRPHDRSDVVGSLLHGALCLPCGANGGHSSIAYDETFDDGAHHAWVAAWPELERALRADTGALVADLEFHEIVARDDADPEALVFDIPDMAWRLAVVLHARCDDPSLVPAGCGDPGADDPCDEAFRAGGLTACWMADYKISLVDAELATLRQQPGLEAHYAARRASWIAKHGR